MWKVVLSYQNYKSQRYFINYYLKHKKAENPDIKAA